MTALTPRAPSACGAAQWVAVTWRSSQSDLVAGQPPSPSTSLRNTGFFLGGPVNLVQCGTDATVLLPAPESFLPSPYSRPVVSLHPYLSALPLPSNKPSWAALRKN